MTDHRFMANNKTHIKWFLGINIFLNFLGAAHATSEDYSNYKRQLVANEGKSYYIVGPRTPHLFMISRDLYGTEENWKDLAAWNSLFPPYELTHGQSLLLKKAMAESAAAIKEEKKEYAPKPTPKHTTEASVEKETHPQKSLDALKSKKIITSPRVQKMILEHHERFDQSGFPNKPPSHKLGIESQILIFANALENANRHQPGKVKKLLKVIITEVLNTGIIRTELVQSIKNLFNLTV